MYEITLAGSLRHSPQRHRPYPPPPNRTYNNNTKMLGLPPLPGTAGGHNPFLPGLHGANLAAAAAAGANGQQGGATPAPSPGNGGFNSLNSSLGYGNNSLASPSISGT